MVVKPISIKFDSDAAATRLMDHARGIGVERGFDLIVDLLYLCWELNESDEGAVQWARLRGTHPDEVMNELLEASREPSGLGQGRLNSSGPDPRLVARLLEDIHHIRSISPDPQGMLAAVFEAMLGIQAGMRSAMFGEHATSTWMADLMAFSIQASGCALDPVSGLGGSLFSLSRAGASSVEGCELNRETARISRMRLRMASIDADIATGDALTDAQKYVNGYDSVAMHPPWGLKLSSQQVEGLSNLGIAPLRARGAGANLVWLELATRFLRPGGRAAILLPQMGQFETEMMEAFLERNSVEAVIAFPRGVVASTTMSGALWVLRGPGCATSEVLMLDAASFAEVTPRSGVVTYSKSSIAELVSVLNSFRDTGSIAAPPHVAAVVRREDLDPRRGLWPPAYLESPPPIEDVIPEPASHLLAAIRLAGFKSFGPEQEAVLAPITLIFGTNSAGKSSLVQVLLLLKQSLDSHELVTQGEIANVGTFGGITHLHRHDRILFGLTFGAPTWDLPAGGTADPTLVRAIEFEFALGSDGRGHLASLEVAAGNFVMPWITGQRGVAAATVDHLLRPFQLLAKGTLLYPYDTRHVTSTDEVDAAKRERRRIAKGRSIGKQLGQSGVEQVDIALDGILPSSRILDGYGQFATDYLASVSKSYVDRIARVNAGVGAELRSILSQLTYLGPLRSAPRRFYERAERGGPAGDGHDVAMYLFDNSTVIERVNDWLKALEIPYALDVVPVSVGVSARLVGDMVAVTLTDLRSHVVVTPADVGFGISQALPIIVELLARQESVICIEQPETHLHPRLQARLADLFVDTTNAAGRRNQLIVETHSEHLLLRLQRRIREGAVSADQVSVLYVDQDDEGVATIQRLRMDEEGDFIDEWPDGFFDDRLGDLLSELL